MPNPITRAVLAGRETRHAPHAVAGLAGAFTPGPQGGSVLVSPLDQSTITLRQVTGQVACAWKGQPLRHMPLTLEEAKRWVAVEVLDALLAQEERVAQARAAITALTRAQLTPAS